MPHFWIDTKTKNEILVVTYSELVPAFYTSEKYLRRKVSEDMARGYGLRRIRKGGGHDSVALLEFDSLPLKIKDRLYDPRKEMHILEQYYEYDINALQFFREYIFEDGRRINKKNQEEYIINASVINAIIKLKYDRETAIKSCGKHPKQIWKSLCDDTTTFNEILDKKYNQNHTLQKNERRFRETIENYKKTGYESLISKYHTTKNAQKVDEKTLALFESLFTSLGYKPGFTDVYEIYYDFINGKKTIISNSTAEVFDPADFKPLSNATIRSYLKKWESKNATLRLRTGDRQKLIQLTKPHHSLDIPKFAGSIISVDDRQPPFEYAKGQRVWFYLGYDIGAQCYTTWVYGKSKEGILIEFYRQMVRNYSEWGFSLPAEIECEASLNSSLKSSLLKEGNMFQYVRIEANNPRGKYIERKNRDARYGEEKQLEGWIARPFVKSEANQSGTKNIPILPYNEIITKVLHTYENYNNTPHPLHPGKTRWEVFCEMQNPGLKPINWHGILPYIGYKTKTSCNVGIIKLNGGECLLGKNGKISTGEDLIKIMKIIEGKQLEVLWLDDNKGKILKAFAYVNGEYICEVLAKPKYNRAKIEQVKADYAARELMSKYVITIENYGKKRKNEIEKITIINESPAAIILKNKFIIDELHTIKPNYLINNEVRILEDNDDFYESSDISETSFRKSFKDTY
ncbi:MAG: hypothetical protein LBQ22_01970 [Bacteroidales bacterium]|jgi:hypothetical protein|nr:hypothetical protein [Bacteroidales bacterium]